MFLHPLRGWFWPRGGDAAGPNRAPTGVSAPLFLGAFPGNRAALRRYHHLEVRNDRVSKRKMQLRFVASQGCRSLEPVQHQRGLPMTRLSLPRRMRRSKRAMLIVLAALLLGT